MAEMLRRIASGVCSLAATAVAIPLGSQMVVYPPAEPAQEALGWMMVAVASIVAVVAGAIAIWGRVPFWGFWRNTKTDEPKWIGIKAAVDYVRGKSGWKTETLGEAWGADLERDLRREFCKLFGPRTRGREYSLLSAGGREPIAPVKPIPRSFWREARFDPYEIIKSPARLIARNENEKRLFDEIEVERVALERAFPKAPPTVHIPMRMTLKECFDADFSGRYLKRSGVVPVADGPLKFDISLLWFQDYHAKSMFVSFYIPRVSDPKWGDYTKAACDHLARNLSKIIEELRTGDDLKIQTLLAGDDTPTHQHELEFSGAVFIYHEGPLAHAEKAEIEELFRSEAKAKVTFRGASYTTTRSLQERTK